MALLFQGRSFWLSRNVPQRNKFMDIIEANGGVVVALENKADIKLVDHTRKQIPAGTYSYQYVENSIRNGKLENLEDHRAGPTSSRSTRSTATSRQSETHKPPPRRSRVEYTLEDDIAMWDFMQPYEETGTGGYAKNPYRAFAEVNPRHTAESYRDRWNKRLRGLPRPGPAQSNEHPQIAAEKDHEVSHTPNAAEEVSRVIAPSTRPGKAQDYRLRREESSTEVGDETLRRQQSVGDMSLRQSMAKVAARRAELANGKTTNSETRPQMSRTSIMDGSSTSLKATNHQLLEAPKETSLKTSSIREANPTEVVSQKRKRTSASDLPSIPAFEVDYQTRKRRATDFAAKRHPSTPYRSELKATQYRDRPSQVSFIDETGPQVFETAPQFQPSQRSLPGLRSGIQGPLEEEDMNLKAIWELPFPTVASESEDDHNPAHTETSHSGSQSIDDWIESRLRSHKSIKERDVIQALRVTSMDPVLADKVLESLVSGKGIPRHMRGVWTLEDDACVEGTDARNIDRVLKKHGTDLYNARFEYLEMIRSATTGL